MNKSDVIESLPDRGVLAEVLEILEAREHEPDCPRNRDDNDCTCGRDALIFRVEQMQYSKDPARYQWLRTRINWKDETQEFPSTGPTGTMSIHMRQWTHFDVRWPEHRPPSETLDEYIDGQLTEVHVGLNGDPHGGPLPNCGQCAAEPQSAAEGER